jgi:hypothetical protein
VRLCLDKAASQVYMSQKLWDYKDKCRKKERKEIPLFFFFLSFKNSQSGSKRNIA